MINVTEMSYSIGPAAPVLVETREAPDKNKGLLDSLLEDVIDHALETRPDAPEVVNDLVGNRTEVDVQDEVGRAVRTQKRHRGRRSRQGVAS